VDEFGDALAAGADEEVRQDVAFPFGGHSCLDQNPTVQRALEGMNNKIKSISHRSFGFRSAKNFIAAIYHCCARLPLPEES